MKHLIAAACATVFLTACDLPEPQKKAMADAAIILVNDLNAGGIDPVKLSPEQRTLMAAGCAFAPAVYPERAADIASACTVALEAAK